jgi:hypothetical protein
MLCKLCILVASGTYLLAVLVEVKREKELFFQSFIAIRTGLYLPFDLSTFKEHDVRALALCLSLCRGTQNQLVPNAKRVLISRHEVQTDRGDVYGTGGMPYNGW